MFKARHTPRDIPHTTTSFAALETEAASCTAPMSAHARPVFPPLDGSITVLPGFVDFHEEHNPDHEWARLAHEDDAPYTPVTFREYAAATHRIAHAFRPDGTRAQGELVAVLIHCDALLYLALIPGLVRAGFVVSRSPCSPLRC